MDSFPLEGLRVLDLTQMLAGPLAGTRLGDLGADVIKIENPDGGEFNRSHGFQDVTFLGEMTTFLAVNRNKKSLPINLKHPQGVELLKKLVKSSDILVHNFRPGVLERLGLGYEDLRAVNPQLIYCAISGYGRVGRLANRPGQDLILQGYSGSMFAVGAEGDPPRPGALWAADAMSGYQAVIGILAALHARSKSRQGSLIEVDMYGVVLDAQLQELVTFLNTGKKPTRSLSPSAHASIPGPYGVYRTQDGWMTLAMSPLPALGKLLDNDWLQSLTDYNDGHVWRDQIFAEIENAFVGQPTAYWVEKADEFGVWAGPVYDYDDLISESHLIDSGLITSQPGANGEVKTVGVPLKINGSRPKIRIGAPSLGADTVKILKSLNLSDEEIRDLIAHGVTRESH
ncbi:MAG: hypothetical protein RL566_699 [Actinomycetota bacterium]|jgi:crotonobetainyl-CoA:carnitine CoA-transferase CaiB-like acyl-CoA transferase